MEPFKAPIFITLALYCFLTFSPQYSWEQEDLDNSTYRLPKLVAPTLYNLTLTLNPENGTFQGIVGITFEIIDQIVAFDNTLYLYADKEYISISYIALNDLIICKVHDSNIADIQQIKCFTGIFVGRSNYLYIVYESKFSEDGYGLVKSTFTEQGEQQALLESYLKPFYARRVFPCMDEPSFPAQFSLKVTHPRDYVILSSSLIHHQDLVPSSYLMTTTFEVSSKISTYLVSLFMSKLQTVIIKSDAGLEFVLFTRASTRKYTQNVVANYYAKILNALSDYLGLPYQSFINRECYHIALPDYYSDAMGGFGLFAYRETEILDEGDNTTNRVTQDIVMTMTYKLSHEWYGGNITTKWWSDIWTNEAVAIYLKYIVADQANSEFDLYNQFVVEVVQKALQFDALPFAQPLSSDEDDIGLKEDIQRKLDPASYVKGASVLHMISYILGGEENFQAALQNHWNQRKESGTNGKDMLLDLAGSNKEYYSYFENWVFLAGYPLVTVAISNTTDETEIVSVSQKRFFYPAENYTLNETQWTIPLTSCISTNKTFDVVVESYLEPSSIITFSYEKDSWIMFNMQGRLFYRVNYDETIWKRLITVLKDKEERNSIHVLSRAQIVDDIFNIARIGDASYSLAFDLVSYLSDETEYYPWYSALNAFSYLLGKMEDDTVEQSLRKFILNIVKSVIIFPSNSFNGTHIDVLNYVQIIEWACNLGNADCINDSLSKFDLFKQSPTDLQNYNLRGMMFCTALRYSTNVLEDWEFLWNLYTTTSSVQEQIDILNALGCVENKNLLEWYLLKTVTTDSGIKRQDALVVFKSVFSSNSLGLEAAMEFLENRLASIASWYKSIDILSGMIYAIAEKLVSDEHLQWLTNLVANEVLDGYENVRSKAIMLTSVNNYWARYYRSQITDILQNLSEAAMETPATTK